MPELPEVETVKRSLQKLVVGQTITNVEVFLPKIVHPYPPEHFTAAVTGLKVENFQRRGKYLLVHLSHGLTLVMHLRMTGRLVYLDDDGPLPKYTHVLFYLDSGHRLAFADMRQFGHVTLLSQAEVDCLPALTKLGPEPLEEHFSVQYMADKLAKRRSKIKGLLLDQTFVAGLGNIYVDEALHRANIHPERTATDLTADEISALYQAIVAVLEQGIKNRGTSFSDYVDGEGKKGSNQHELTAYQREGEPCHQCGNLILRKKVAGRSSYYCPHCQRL